MKNGVELRFFRSQIVAIFSASEFHTPRIKSWHMCERAQSERRTKTRVMKDPSQAAPPPLPSSHRGALRGTPVGSNCPKSGSSVRPEGGGGAEVVTGKYPDQKFGIHLSYADYIVLVDCHWSKYHRSIMKQSPPHHTQRVIGGWV